MNRHHFDRNGKKSTPERAGVKGLTDQPESIAVWGLFIEVSVGFLIFTQS
jgi:hypothetical protein